MRLTLSPLVTLGATVVTVLGFDLIAALATRLSHVPYVDFMLPDLALFGGIGFLLAHRLPVALAFFHLALAALVEATAGRALATALDAETSPPATTAAFLVLETIAVGGFTLFWGAIGVAVALLLPRRR